MLFRRTDPEILRARCTAAAAVVERRLRAHSEAVAGYLAQSGSPEACERLDAAEELLYLAEWELRRANRALAQASRHRWLPHPATWRSAR
jgi:hypothetical protein